MRVPIKCNGIGNFDRHMPDLHVNSQRYQGCQEFFVEIGNRAGCQWDDCTRSFAGLNNQVVIKEIELCFEDTAMVGDWGSGETARADVERHFPPMVDERAQSQSDFADDLGPHVKRIAGILPGFERQGRP